MHLFLTKRQCYQNLVSSRVGLLVWSGTWRSGIRPHLWIHFQSTKTYSTGQGIHWWRSVYFFYIQRTASKSTPVDEKFSGQACEWLHYRRQFVYNSNYIVRTNICRLLEFLLLPVHWKDQVLKRKYRQSYTVCFWNAYHHCSAGSMKFSTQSDEWISICIIICIVSTCVFCWTSCALKVYTSHNSRRSLKEIQFTSC